MLTCIRFVLIPAGSHTEITWSFDGADAFMRKLIGLAFNYDQMIGGSFASGLKDLQTIFESPPTA